MTVLEFIKALEDGKAAGGGEEEARDIWHAYLRSNDAGEALDIWLRFTGQEELIPGNDVELAQAREREEQRKRDRELVVAQGKVEKKAPPTPPAAPEPPAARRERA